MYSFVATVRASDLESILIFRGVELNRCSLCGISLPFHTFSTGNGKKLLKMYIDFIQLFKEKYLLFKEPLTLDFSILTKPCTR